MSRPKIVRGRIETIRRLPDSLYGKQYEFNIITLDNKTILAKTRVESVFGYFRVDFDQHYDFAMIDGEVAATNIEESF